MEQKILKIRKKYSNQIRKKLKKGGNWVRKEGERKRKNLQVSSQSFLVCNRWLECTQEIRLCFKKTFEGREPDISFFFSWCTKDEGRTFIRTRLIRWYFGFKDEFFFIIISNFINEDHFVDHKMIFIDVDHGRELIRFWSNRFS